MSGSLLDASKQRLETLSRYSRRMPALAYFLHPSDLDVCLVTEVRPYGCGDGGLCGQPGGSLFPASGHERILAVRVGESYGRGQAGTGTGTDATHVSLEFRISDFRFAADPPNRFLRSLAGLARSE